MKHYNIKQTQKIKNYINIIFIFFLCFSNVQAEQKNNENNASIKIPNYFWGAYAHFNYNVHSADFHYLPNCFSCCPNYNSATGGGFSVGALFEKNLPSVLDGFLIGARLGYADLSAEFAELENIGNVELRDPNPPFETKKIVSAQSTHYLESTLNALNLNLYAADKFLGGLTASLGFNFNFLLNNKFNQREELTSPKNLVFSGGEADGKRVRNIYPENDIPEAKQFQFGLSLGLGYELPIGENSFLIPEMRYNLFFTNVSSVNWKPNFLQFGVAIKFPTYNGTETIEPKYERDTIFEKRFDIEKEYIELVETLEEDNVIYEKYKHYIKSQSKLKIDFTNFGIDTNGVRQKNPTIIIEEFYTTESFPILPNIYFKDGSSNINTTKMKLLSEEQANNFNEKTIKIDALEVYYNLLNIFGKRLRENPNTKIIIAGYSSGENSDKNMPKIAAKRAEVIKKYLTDIWKIPTAQLKVETRTIPKHLKARSNDITRENSKVELIPLSGFEKALPLYMPIKLSHVEKKANPPVVEFDINIDSESDIDYYSLKLKQDNQKIREFNGSGKDTNIKILWEIEKTPLPVTESPISTNLEVQDILGQQKSLEKELEIKQVTIKKKKELIVKDWKIDKYSLVLFEYNKSDISYVDKEILKEIKANIKPNSEVSIIISGFADRTGDIQYNKNLAQKRCQEVAKELNVKNIQLKAIGSKKLIFDNDLPEGRALSRTVQIEVRTPLK